MSFRFIPPGRGQPMGKLRSFVKRPAEYGVSSSTGRYSPGQELYGIAFSYRSKKMSSIGAPMLWDEEYPSAIHFIKLKVTEHHRVPNEFDEKQEPTLDCDGYKLVDEKGRVFLNQFPRASYGQITDNGDRQFREDWKGDFNERFKTDKEDPSEFTLLTEMFATIAKGIRDLEREMAKSYKPGKYSQGITYYKLQLRAHTLRKLKAEIEARFTEKFENKVVYAVPRLHGTFFNGKIANDQREAWLDQFVPVSTKRELVEAFKKLKRHVVDHRVRLLPGFYTRFYSDTETGVVHDEPVRVGGFQSRKEKKRGRHSKAKWTYQYKGRYRSVWTGSSSEKELKGSRGSYITDMAQSGILIANCAALYNFQKEMAKCGATGFEMKVLFKGWPDTAERYLEYRMSQEHAVHMNELHYQALDAYCRTSDVSYYD